MGCWGIGGTYEIAGKPEGIPEFENPNAILRYAFNSGINTFDTSTTYGKSETILGKTYAHCRENIFIASKCGIIKDGSRNFDFDYIYRSIQNSLKRLQTHYLDLFQLTLSNHDDIHDKMIENLITLKKKKLSRFIGISISNYSQGLKVLSYDDIDSLQFVLNLIDTRNVDLLELCKKRNCLPIIKSPLNKGVLTQKKLIFDSNDSRMNYLTTERIQLRRKIAHKILNSSFNAKIDNHAYIFSENVDLKEKAILFTLSLINNGVVLFGVRKKEHIDELIKFNQKSIYNEKTLDSLIKHSNEYFNAIKHTL